MTKITTQSYDEYRPASKEEEIVRRAFICALLCADNLKGTEWLRFWAEYQRQRDIDEKSGRLSKGVVCA